MVKFPLCDSLLRYLNLYVIFHGVSLTEYAREDEERIQDMIYMVLLEVDIVQGTRVGWRKYDGFLSIEVTLSNFEYALKSSEAKKGLGRSQ